MSGPKHSTFDVRENELRRQRERASALAEVARLGSDLETSLAQLANMSPDSALLLRNEFTNLSRIADGSDHAKLLDLPAQMRTLRDRALATLGRSVAQLQQRDALVSRLNEGSDEVARREEERTARILDERDRWLAPLNEALAELKFGATSKELERIQRIEALANDANQARESLKFDAMAIQSAIEHRIASAREAADLRIRLGGHSDKEASTIANELTRVEAGDRTMTPELRSRATKAIDRLEMAEDRIFVAHVLADGFRDLGYFVDESFVTAFERGDTLEISRSVDQPYAAQLKFDLEKLEVDSELVVVEERHHLTGEAIAHNDQIAEQSWCGDLAKVLAAARSKGIQGTAKPRRKIGSAPVRSVVDRQGRRAGRNMSDGQQNRIGRTIKP